MAENEALAMDILKQNRQIHQKFLKNFGCIFSKEMGDGYMAVFGSMSDAIYASANILQAANSKNIALRIGIHEGDVIFENSDVYGDGVNIAARIEQQAAPGSIYVSENVQRDLANRQEIQAEFIRDEQLKNVRGRTKLFRIDVDMARIPKHVGKGGNNNRFLNKQKWILGAGILAFAAMVFFIFTTPAFQEFYAGQNIDHFTQLPGNSIAILPFQNQGSNQEFDYLGVGIADGILTKLSMLNDFVIISRSSSFRFQNSEKSLSEIAAQLGVEMILEGSYQIMSNDIRINAKLVDVKGNKNLLAETYTGELEQLFKLQDKASEGLFDLLDKSQIDKARSDKGRPTTKIPGSIQNFTRKGKHD